MSEFAIIYQIFTCDFLHLRKAKRYYYNDCFFFAVQLEGDPESRDMYLCSGANIFEKGKGKEI